MSFYLNCCKPHINSYSSIISLLSKLKELNIFYYYILLNLFLLMNTTIISLISFISRESGYSFDNKSNISNGTSPRIMTEDDPLKFDSESQTSLIFRDNQEIKLRYVG